MNQTAPLPVIYIVGSGRSGSTLLTSILGQATDCFAAGEMRFLWDRGLVADDPCGCGEDFSECPVWQAIVNSSDFRPTKTAARHVASALAKDLRIRRLPQLRRRRNKGQLMLEDDDIAASITNMYRSISKVTGARVVVDSSKLPLYGALLGQLPGLELRLVHLVRDPRAAAYSWKRKKTTRDRSDGGQMTRMGSLKSIALWSLWNGLVYRWWSDTQVIRIRYEDLVQRPREVSMEVARRCGLDPKSLPFENEKTVLLAPTHTVAGNPSRHSIGSITVRPDMAWRGSVTTSSRILVRVLAGRLMNRLGYRAGARE